MNMCGTMSYARFDTTLTPFQTLCVGAQDRLRHSKRGGDWYYLRHAKRGGDWDCLKNVRQRGEGLFGIVYVTQRDEVIEVTQRGEEGDWENVTKWKGSKKLFNNFQTNFCGYFCDQQSANDVRMLHN